MSDTLPASAPNRAATPPDTATQATRTVGLSLALLGLAAASITAFYSALRVASIWFEPRFVPIAHLVVAGATIAVCVQVVRRLKRPA